MLYTRNNACERSQNVNKKSNSLSFSLAFQVIHRNESRWPPLPPVIKIAMQSKMEIGRKNRIFYVFSSLNLSYYCVEDNVLKTTTDFFLFFMLQTTEQRLFDLGLDQSKQNYKMIPCKSFDYLFIYIRKIILQKTFHLIEMQNGRSQNGFHLKWLSATARAAIIIRIYFLYSISYGFLSSLYTNSDPLWEHKMCFLYHGCFC